MSAAAYPIVTLEAQIAALMDRGDFAGAEKHAVQALLAYPAHAEFIRLRAIAQLQTGAIDAAHASLQEALRLAPDSVGVLCNLASVETARGQTATAVALLARALAQAPNHRAALNNLARLYQDGGEYERAAAFYERCVRQHPDYLAAWLNFAHVRGAQRRWAEAEDLVRGGLRANPNSADAWFLLGVLAEQRQKLHDALAAYRRSVELKPDPRSVFNLALIQDRLGDMPDAVRSLEHALELDPNHGHALAHLVFNKRRLCDWKNLDVLSARLIAAVDAHQDGITAFSFLAEDSTPAQQLTCARAFGEQFRPRQPVAAAPQIGMHDMLRVGFVSSGFTQHATGLLVVELIERLRDSGLRTQAFATTPDDATTIRRRLRAGFHEFHDVSGLGPEQIAKSIREARSDILIDIDGYCMNSMPQLFALKPAPIQVNWLAYPGSLGAPWYDYLIADRYVIGAAQRAHYDEKIAYLPRCYQPTDTTRTIGQPQSREAYGLPASGFVYCCFNNSWKFSPESFARWMRILRAVPDSVLWLLDGPPAHGIADRLRHAAQAAGVDPPRLVFAGNVKHSEYLPRYRHADLFLDTNPYNAHTTASDALFAGCPVLTRSGDTFASRVAGSLNHQLGLDELNVDGDAAYVAKAIEFATQPQQLAALRAKLTDPIERARLFDMRAYANDFTQLLIRMAERARRGEAAQDIFL